MINIIPNVRFLTTLRNSGYNNYTALADIIDNSLDTNVGTKNVRVKINNKTQKDYAYDSIIIADDGCGMSYTNLTEALKLGADTGKSKASDLGSYGTGLKAAALSIGRKLTIKTKSENDKFYMVDFDLDVLIDKNTFSVDIIEGSDKDYESFKEQTKSETGTIIELSKLDRVTNKSLTAFRDKLIENLSLFYRLFIEQGVSIYVNDSKIVASDPMHRHSDFCEMLSGEKDSFTYDGNKFEFTAFYLKKSADSKQNTYRNTKSVGLYVYRNNRLVGQGLKLGIITSGDTLADGWSNGLKIELFVNGEADHLFGSTFMKMIHEKDKSDIDQGFLEECKKAVYGYVKDVVQRNKASEKVEKNQSPELSDELNTIMSSINSNELMKVESDKEDIQFTAQKDNKKDGENVSNGNAITDKTDTPVSKTKINADWELISLGENGKLFRLNRSKGKYILSINVDHVFYTDFLVNATIEVKACMIRLYIAMGISLDSFYYDDEETKELILDEYLLEISSNLRKLIVG